MNSRSASFVKTIVLVPLMVLLLFTFTGRTAPPAVDSNEGVLIRTSKPYQSLVTRIEALGGTVTQQYKYVDAIAAEIPRNALSALRSDLAPGSISKDLIVPAPKSVDTTAGRGLAQSGDETQITAEDVQSIAIDDGSGSINPNAYLINNSIMNVTPLLAGGTTGAASPLNFPKRPADGESAFQARVMRMPSDCAPHFHAPKLVSTAGKDH